jgi:transposase
VNVLSDDKKQQVLALGRLGWSLRDIEEAVQVRRETASGYLKAAGIAVRPPRTRRPPPVGDASSKPASREGVSTDSAGVATSRPASRDEVSTDSAGVATSKPASRDGVSTDFAPAIVVTESTPGRSPNASACEPHRDFIEAALRVGRNAKAIWQDLVTQHGFTGGYASVKRFARKQRGVQTPEERVVIETAPGREAQVDYGEGPMVRHPETGKYRRTRLFVMTLGFSRKTVRLLTWSSSSRVWAELHEQAFRRLGGATATVVLDNLREGVLKPDVYDPQLNPLYRDVLAHYGVTALPCRVRNPDRKGKVESGVGHAQRTPLKGLRFETLEDAQRYLDEWEARWADTRIHGTTKRQVAAMFADERPHLLPLPVEPFRFYSYGERIVHLDGCVEVGAAYYHAPPGWIGRTVHVQWDGLRVRLLDKSSGALLREYVVQKRGGRRVRHEDRPKQTPKSTLYLLGELTRAGQHVATLADQMRRTYGDEDVIRKLQGVRSLVKKYGAANVDDASAAVLELGLHDYRSLRRYLERRPAAPLSLEQVNPIIRQLEHYRDLIEQKTQGDNQ